MVSNRSHNLHITLVRPVQVGFVGMTRALYREAGLAGFFTGVEATLLRQSAGSARTALAVALHVSRYRYRSFRLQFWLGKFRCTNVRIKEGCVYILV